MIKTLVVCGDSFNCGIGCVNMMKQPYGILVSKELNFDLITLARGSASNYVTHLQAEYAAEMDPPPHLIIIGSTSYHRTEWVAHDSVDVPESLTAANIQYGNYPPYKQPMPLSSITLPFWFKGRADYNPVILSETFSNLALQLESIKKKSNSYERLGGEPLQKLKSIINWCIDILNPSIKRGYDIGILLKAYMRVKAAGINCLVLTPDYDLQNLLPEKDFLHIDWFSLSEKYPDRVGTLHASEEAHQLVARQILEKIRKNGYD